MGYSARHEHVLLLLVALEAVLRRQGWRAEPGPGVDAALATYAAAGAGSGVVGHAVAPARRPSPAGQARV